MIVGKEEECEQREELRGTLPWSGAPSPRSAQAVGRPGISEKGTEAEHAILFGVFVIFILCVILI